MNSFHQEKFKFFILLNRLIFFISEPIGGQDVGSGSGDLSRGKQKISCNIINVSNKRSSKEKQGFMIIKLTLFQCEF